MFKCSKIELNDILVFQDSWVNRLRLGYVSDVRYETTFINGYNGQLEYVGFETTYVHAGVAKTTLIGNYSVITNLFSQEQQKHIIQSLENGVDIRDPLKDLANQTINVGDRVACVYNDPNHTTQTISPNKTNVTMCVVSAIYNDVAAVEYKGINNLVNFDRIFNLERLYTEFPEIML